MMHAKGRGYEMATGQEIYYPFYGSLLTVLATGIFAIWQGRPKTKTDNFSALVKAYSQLNKEFCQENDRLRRENAELRAHVILLENEADS